MKSSKIAAPWSVFVVDRCLLGATLVFLCLAMPGCGAKDTGRYRVSGSVTYQGNPVQHGTIMFEPDTSKGNSGGAGSAVIINGKFDSDQGGIGCTGGPQIVSIQGFSGNDIDPEYAPYGTPIGGGKSYIKSFDFSDNENIEQDFEMADVIDAK